MEQNNSWHYVEDGQSVGPFGQSEMEQKIRDGVIRADTLVWPGSGDWIAAGTSSLAAAFSGGSDSTDWLTKLTAPHPRFAKYDFLPKDPRLRLAIMVVAIAIGMFSMADGCRQMQDGAGGGAFFQE